MLLRSGPRAIARNRSARRPGDRQTLEEERGPSWTWKELLPAGVYRKPKVKKSGPYAPIMAINGSLNIDQLSAENLLQSSSTGH